MRCGGFRGTAGSRDALAPVVCRGFSTVRVGGYKVGCTWKLVVALVLCGCVGPKAEVRRIMSEYGGDGRQDPWVPEPGDPGTGPGQQAKPGQGSGQWEAPGQSAARQEYPAPTPAVSQRTEKPRGVILGAVIFGLLAGAVSGALVATAIGGGTGGGSGSAGSVDATSPVVINPLP